MFPLQRGHELVIHFSNGVNHQQQKISQDLILDDDYASDDLDLNYSDKKFGCRPEKIIFDKVGKNHGNYSNENKKKKKMVHREIERQRRQEMATLHASLRTLLPLEFIKGKRSISDHINEAVNYIRHLEKNIKELGAKRDELKKLSDSNKLGNHDESKHIHGSFTFHENSGAVGIEIKSGFKEERIPLSKFLELLLKEGLEVVNCLSTEVNGRLLHSVQCQVNDSKNCVDLSELRRKLSNVIP